MRATAFSLVFVFLFPKMEDKSAENRWGGGYINVRGITGFRKYSTTYVYVPTRRTARASLFTMPFTTL